MMRFIQILVLLITTGLWQSAVARGQQFVNFDWEHHYGTAQDETLGRAILTADGGWLFSGSTNERFPHYKDLLLLKLDAHMRETWRSVLDYYVFESPVAVAESPDHGFLIASSYQYSPGDFREGIRMIKINSDGDSISSSELFSFNLSGPIKLLNLPDSRFALILDTSSLALTSIFILDDSGQILRHHVSAEHHSFQDAVVGPDGSLCILTKYHRDACLYLTKYDTEGGSLWSQNVDSSGETPASLVMHQQGGFAIARPPRRNDSLLSVTICDDHGRVVLTREFEIEKRCTGLHFVSLDNGFAIGATHQSGVETLRLNSQLETVRQELITHDEAGFDLHQTTDLLAIPGNGFAICGTSMPLNHPESGSTGRDYFCLSFTSEGEVASSDVLGNSIGCFERALDVVDIDGDGFALLVQTDVTVNAQNCPAIYRTDADGDTLWTRTYYIPGLQPVNYYDFAGKMDMARDQFGAFYILGEYLTQDSSGCWLLKASAEGDSLWTVYIRPPDFTLCACPPRVMLDSQQNPILAFNYYNSYDEHSFESSGCLMKYSGDGINQLNYFSDHFAPVDAYISRDDEVVVLETHGRLSWFDLDLNLLRTLQLDFSWYYSYACESILADNDGGWFVCGEPHDCGCTCSDVRRYNSAGAPMFISERIQGFGRLYPGPEATVIFMTSGGGLNTLTPDSGRITTGKYFNTDSYPSGDRFCSQILMQDDGFVCVGDQTGDAWIGRTTFEALPAPKLVFSPSSVVLTAFPNPFNSSTTISYTLPRAGHYSLTVTDITGREVARLSEGWKSAGSYREVWDGGEVGSGTYLLRLQNGQNEITTPINLIK